MNSLKKIFNWFSKTFDPDTLFPKEWDLSEGEKNHLKSNGYKIIERQLPVIGPHYGMPPTALYDVQYIKKANGDALNEAEIEHVQRLLDQYKSSSPSQANNTPT